MAKSFGESSRLIRNAIDTMPCGGGLVISLRVEHDKTAAEMTDTAVGISEESKKHSISFFATIARGLGTGVFRKPEVNS
jgi:C4-dicarboxylate-specific signal transduction histidine kinase